MRTDLLDSQPAILVENQAPSGDIRTLELANSPAYVVPLREELTLIDFATPEDCATQSAEQFQGGLLSVERTLFDHFLEKGVIRSGRLFAAVVSGEIDDVAAGNFCYELLSSELPLTT